MAFITWKTPSGSLGTVAQSAYYEFLLAAESGESIEYTHIAGNLPIGLQVSADGRVKGVPVIDSTGANQVLTSTFTVRANTPSGAIADRTFSITVNNYSPIRINLTSQVLGTFNDGTKLEFQFTAVSDNPNPDLTWSIVDGETPIDIVTGNPIGIDSRGRLTGYISRYVDTVYENSGYDNTNNDVFGYDFNPVSQDRSYVFTVQVADGSSFDRATVRLDVVSKSNFTADNLVITVDSTKNTADTDKKYVPIITTDPTSIPVLAAGDKFSFKFDAIDPESDVVFWKTNNAAAAAGMSISTATGWLTGTAPAQSETVKTYSFQVTAYKRDFPNLVSAAVTVELIAVKNRDDYLTWTTPSDLGSIVNGSVSELSVQAASNTNRPIVYSLASGVANRLPQGLKLLDTGSIVGQASFQYFSLDGASSVITVANTANITNGMAIQGPGVASGCLVSQVIDRNRVRVAPAIYVAEGSVLTFSDLLSGYSVSTQLTDLSTSTQIDGNKTTFDCTFKFTAVATTNDSTVTASKQFTVTVDNYNRAPYENVYIKALPGLDQRNSFTALLADQEIFPEDALYRNEDANFGIAQDIKLLFLPGLAAGSLGEYAIGVLKNHYSKRLTFGAIKTARAVNADLSTRYEVVYVDVLDNQQGASLELIPGVSHYYNEDSSNSKIYPNSFDNMARRLSEALGYSNRGALPGWMTSRQTNGRVLGLTRAVVLAYTKPGTSAKIAYRLAKSGFDFNAIDFVADRYQVAKGITAEYSTDTNSFEPSKETTFDRIGTSRGNGSISVNAGSRNVSGVDTDFLKQLSRGQTLYYVAEGTGTVTVEGNRVYGTDTRFTELAVSEYIFSHMAPIGTVARIVSDTELELSLEANSFTDVEFYVQRRLGTVAAVNSNTLLSLTNPSDQALFQSEYAHASLATTFDAANTLFYNNRDKFLLPEEGDKYVKYAQLGVFK